MKKILTLLIIGASVSNAFADEIQNIFNNLPPRRKVVDIFYNEPNPEHLRLGKPLITVGLIPVFVTVTTPRYVLGVTPGTNPKVLLKITF